MIDETAGLDRSSPAVGLGGHMARARRLQPPSPNRTPEVALRASAPLPSGVETTTVLVAERQRWVGDALATWLTEEGFSVIATLTTEGPLLDVVQKTQPQLALLDLDLPHRGGLLAGQIVTSASPTTKTILLSPGTQSVDDREVRAAGFFGHISKAVSPSDAMRWLRMAMTGNRPGPEHAAHTCDSATPGRLTCRERQILYLLGRGGNARRIAEGLGISHHTVRTHIQNILGKLNVRSRLEAVAVAAARGLIATGGGMPMDAGEFHSDIETNLRQTS